jgi:hypothetical protein
MTKILMYGQTYVSQFKICKEALNQKNVILQQHKNDTKTYHHVIKTL